MIYYQMALAINKNDIDKLTFTRQPDNKVIKHTPDEDYLILTWDWGDYPLTMNDSNKLREEILHSWVQLSDEGYLYQSVIDENEHGCDGVFDDILVYELAVNSWGEDIPISSEQEGAHYV